MGFSWDSRRISIRKMKGTWDFGIPISQMRTVVLVDLPTKLGDFVWANVDLHSSTMENMGMET